MPHGVIAHAPDGRFDLAALTARARAWEGLTGLDLALPASCPQPFDWTEGLWSWPGGYAVGPEGPVHHAVVVDYGVKRNILRALASAGARVTVVPARTSAEDILARDPDGVVLSNGPGDPAATAAYAVPRDSRLVGQRRADAWASALATRCWRWPWAAGPSRWIRATTAPTIPVKDLATGRVEIVSMNHGFTVDRASLPDSLEETHVSLFDGSNAGLALKGRPVFSVQHHPEASPGPTDSLPVFERFARMMETARAMSRAS